MELSYKRDAAHNYMIPQSEGKMDESDYQIRMMLENHVKGLLPCSLKTWNGRTCCYYDITSKQSMSMIYEKEKMREQDIKKLLSGLYTALTSAKKYLLNTDHLVLEPEVIYMDIETREPLFLFLPAYQEGGILTSFAGLTTFILQHLDQSDDAGVLLGFEIYRKAMEKNYSLENLLKQAIHMEREIVHENSQAVKTEIRPMQAKVYDAETTVQKEPVIQEKQMEDRPRARGRANDPKRQQKTGKKNQIFLAAGILCITSGAAAAAWLIGLNTTQIGGVVFFIVGLTGYLISIQKKHKKTPQEQIRMEEKKADKRSRKSMKRIRREQKAAGIVQEESVHQNVPTAYPPTAPVNQLTSSIHQAASLMQQSVSPIHQANTSVRQSDPCMGATVLLDAGEEAYQPKLSLISMNPRERNSIILLKDKYMIGKMKSKCDVVIDHPAISRIHASIEKEGDTYYLQDMNSTNGTFLNGKRLVVNERVPIGLTDEIRFAELGYYAGKT